METLIDPMNLTDQHKTLLTLLFKQTEGKISIFEPNTPYPITLPPSKKTTQEAETININLTHTIYKRPRKKHPKECRYDILDSKKIEEGQHSAIHAVLGNLKTRTRLGKTTLELNKEKKKPRLSKVEHFFNTKTIKIINAETHQPEKIRIKDQIDDAFVQKIYDRVYNEMQLANLAGSGHMKQPAILIDHENRSITSYTTMRKRKGSCLFDIVLQARDLHAEKQYTTLQLLEISLSALLALKAMHGKHVIHRDVKSENMFYRFDKNQTKFIDFGYAKIKNTQDTTGSGTENYIPPELFNDGQSDEKSDLYSLGITLSLLWGNKEQNTDNEGRLLRRHAGAYYPPDFSTLFIGTRTDFSRLERTMFVNWFEHITKEDRADRASVQEAITDLTDFIDVYKKTRGMTSKKTNTNHQQFNLFNKKRAPVNDTKTPEAIPEKTPRLSGNGSH